MHAEVYADEIKKRVHSTASRMLLVCDERLLVLFESQQARGCWRCPAP
jgi:hypothetical protein